MRWLALAIAVAGAALLATGSRSVAAPPARPPAQGGPVHVGRVSGVVNAGTARHVQQVIQGAERAGAPAAVLTLDSSAGYESATRQVVQHIEQASLPVVVFVSPTGAQATGAGLFVLQAADVAAMSQGTNTGGAGVASGAAPPAPAAAFGAGLAQTRGRDARWVQGAILSGAALSATEALRRNVVDEVASDVPDLLSKIDGRDVSGPWGTRALVTRGAPVQEVEPGWLERVLEILVDPNVAYLLLVLGIYGVLTEIAAPGVTVPGVAGGIALVLALFAFANLPVNWVGIVLILVAAGLFLAESQVASHGLFTLAGLATFIAGSVLLFRSPGGAPSPYGATGALNPWLVALLGLGTAAGFGWLLRQSLATQRQPPANALPQDGETGIAGPMVDATGTVSLGGQTWSAEWAPGTITPGQRVRVVGRKGLKLIVEPADETSPPG